MDNGKELDDLITWFGWAMILAGILIGMGIGGAMALWTCQ